MRTGIVRQIGVIAPRINSDSVSEIMAGISETLGSHEYMPVLGNSDYRDLLELQYLDSMEMIRVAGIILMGRGMTPQLEEALGKLKVPVVITGQDHPGYACVFHDDFHAMRDLTCRMLERGRRDLVYLGVTEEDPAAGLARRRGVEAAVEQAGGGIRLRREITRFTAEDGFRCMQAVLEDGCRPDGVLCASDGIALGAMRALREAGIGIPGDASVAGIGDSWAGAVAAPPLTTVRLHYRECGKTAAEMLLSMIGQPEAPSDRRVMLGYTLIERGSI
jgi:LacI family sucrose operon transcriptional repressor